MSLGNHNGSGASVIRTRSDGSFSTYYTNYDHGVRPVVSLKSDVTISGDRTRGNPFVVFTE